MIIEAKFASTCPSCHHPIAVGEKVEWKKGDKARHVTCPSAVEAAASPSTASPRKPARPAAFKDEKPRKGAIAVEVQLPACKRHELPSFLGEVRRLDDPSAEKEGCRYFVVETQSAHYASASDNEDFHGEFGGACWWVTLGGRPATAEEAEPVDRAHREARADKVLRQLPRWIAEQVRRREYHLEEDVRVPASAWRYAFRRAFSGNEMLYVTEDAVWYATSHYDDGPQLWRRPLSVGDAAAVAEMIDFVGR